MPAADFVAAHLVRTPICAFHSRDDDTVPVAEDRGVITGVLAAAKLPRPQYPAAGTKEYFLVWNPSLASHRAFAESVRQQRGTKEFAIAGATLDLIYNELPIGGHGIWPAVYNMPPIYDWMFSHELPLAQNQTNAAAATDSSVNAHATNVRARPNLSRPSLRRQSLRNRLQRAFGILTR
jgi:hypothetical protein